MLELKEWVKQKHFADRPWLLLGKGPTFSKRQDFDLDGFNKFSLNHVVREQKVEVAHIIDVDVVESCGDAIANNAQWLIVPRIPNVKCLPGEYLTLADWCQCLPALAEMEKRGRLVTYDFSHLDSDDSWTVVARYFSSEAALGILGRMGVKKIHSLGIDGGVAYSPAFDDLTRQTLFANGQQSFDLQFDRLQQIAEHFKIDFAPLASATSVPAVAPQAVVSESDAASLSMPMKVQNMEQEIRDLRAQLKATREELQATAKELKIVTDRLGWARNEIGEYRERVLSMEKNLHTLYKSKTWKLGRVFTKPADVLKKGLHKT